MGTETSALQEAKLAVMDAVRAAAKDKRMGAGGGGSYQYTSIGGLLDDIRPAMIRHGLTLVPLGYKVIQCGTIPMGGKTWQHLVVLGYFKLSHSSGQYERLCGLGEGADGGDKAANKAQTSALKNVILKTFLLQGDGDDPDDYSSEDGVKRGHEMPKAELPKAEPVRSSPSKETVDAYRMEVRAAYDQLPLTADWTAISDTSWPIMDRRIRQECKDADTYGKAMGEAKAWAALAWVSIVIKKAATHADLDRAALHLNFVKEHSFSGTTLPVKWTAAVGEDLERRRKEIPAEIKSAPVEAGRKKFDELLNATEFICFDDAQPAELFQKSYPELAADKRFVEFSLCQCKWIAKLISNISDESDDDFVQTRIGKLRGKVDAAWTNKLDNALKAKRDALKATKRIPA